MEDSAGLGASDDANGVPDLPPGDAEATYRRGRRRRTRRLVLAGSGVVAVALIIGIGVTLAGSTPDIPPISEIGEASHPPDAPGEPGEPDIPDDDPGSIGVLEFLRWEEWVRGPGTLLDIVVDEEGFADTVHRLVDSHLTGAEVDFDRHVLLFVTHSVGGGTCRPRFHGVVVDGDRVEIHHGTVADDGTYHPPGEPGPAPHACTRETGAYTVGIAVEATDLPSGEVTFEATGIEGIDFAPVTVDLPPPTADDRDPRAAAPADPDPDAITPPCEDIREAMAREQVNSFVELWATYLEIWDDWPPLIEARDTRTPDQRFYGGPIPGTLGSIGMGYDRVAVSIAGGDDSVLREFTQRYGTELVCLEIFGEPGEPIPDDIAVIPLAKIEGWALPGIEELDEDDEEWEWDPSAWFNLSSVRLEIAADEATAAQAWSDIVPGDLGPPEYDLEHPSQPGIYGSLDDVDFTSHVVGVWRHGESGSCPGWLATIVTDDDGDVHYEEGAVGSGWCTDDFSSYTMIVVLARDQLPDLDTLPARLRGGWENPDEPELSAHDEVVLYPT